VQRYKAILVVDLTNVSLNMLRGKKGQVWQLCVALPLTLRLAPFVGVAVCETVLHGVCETVLDGYVCW
jgi:hypothetical protein